MMSEDTEKNQLKSIMEAMKSIREQTAREIFETLDAIDDMSDYETVLDDLKQKLLVEADISLCKRCNCMTKDLFTAIRDKERVTICGKCEQEKESDKA